AGRVAEAAVASSTSASTPQAFSPEVRSSVMVWSVGSAVIAVLSSDAVIWASQVPLPAGSGRGAQTTLGSLRSPVVARRRLSTGAPWAYGALPLMGAARTSATAGPMREPWPANRQAWMDPAVSADAQGSPVWSQVVSDRPGHRGPAST